MMVPEAWENAPEMDPAKRAFYEFHSALMEPWDGPACVTFTDGTLIGAVLDRNGLRPSRWWETADGRVDPVLRGRRARHPGRPGRAQGPAAAREDVPRRHRAGARRRRRGGQGRARRRAPLRRVAARRAWSRSRTCRRASTSRSAPSRCCAASRSSATPRRRCACSSRRWRSKGMEPIGSMGTDTPVAVLSERPRLLFDYFSQLFAQVTNPPLDAIREELVTSVAATIGPEQNLLDPGPASCRQIALPFPVLDNDELAKIQHVNDDGDLPGFAAVTVHGLYPVNGGGEALRDALDRVRREVSTAIAAGARIVVLSDRDSTETMAPIPSLLLTSAVHHHLIREKTRTRVGLVVEAGDAREIHHVALLIGYGAAAVNPYLAFETIEQLISDGDLHVDPKVAVKNYIKAAGKGVLKVMSKMGISTIASYTGAQVFEALGLSPGPRRRVLHRHHQPARRHRPGGRRRRGGRPPPPRLPGEPGRAGPPRPGDRRGVPVAPRGRGAPVQPRDGVRPAALHPHPAVRRLQAVHGQGRRAVGEGRHAARPVPPARGPAPGDQRRRGRAGQRDRHALQHRRDVARLDQPRGARDARDRHEPARRPQQHRRGRRGPGAPVRPGPAQRDQAGRVRPLRRHQRVPRQRRRHPDQDGPGRQARRGRAAARPEGQPLHRQDPALDARRRPDQPAAAPRHLLHRGPRPAHPRPQEREPRGPGPRQARRRGRRRDGRGGRLQGARRRRAHLRPRRRHRRLAADLAQARRLAVGARARRDAADAAAQRPARPHHGAGRRAAQDRPRRRHRRPAGRRGVRLRDGPAGRQRLHHDARLPPRHLPRRRRDAEPGAARRGTPARPSSS